MRSKDRQLLRAKAKYIVFIIVYEKKRVKEERRIMENQNDVRNTKVWNKPLMTCNDYVKIKSMMRIDS